MSEILGRRALNRALLARQLLLERASMPAVDALEHLVGLQAQAPRPPYVGLWTRLKTFDPQELADLIADRRGVRIALQRGTIHAVSARDGLILRPLHQSLFDRWLRQLAPRLDGGPLDTVVVAARELLQEAPLTLAALGRRLGERWPEADRDGACCGGAPLGSRPPRPR